MGYVQGHVPRRDPLGMVNKDVLNPGLQLNGASGDRRQAALVVQDSGHQVVMLYRAEGYSLLTVIAYAMREMYDNMLNYCLD